MVTVDMVRFVNAVLKNDEQSTDDELRKYFDSCDIPSEVVDYCIHERNQFLNKPSFNLKVFDFINLLARRKSPKPRLKCEYTDGKLGKITIKGATYGKRKSKVETFVRRAKG